VTKKVTIGKGWDGEALQLSFVLIPPGEFQMGSTEDEVARLLTEAKENDDEAAAKRIPREAPQHRVRITKPFYLGQHEVTQEQWQAIMGGSLPNPSQPRSFPRVDISWDGLQDLLAKLNNIEQGEPQFDLPTEAQWEYACRAGSTSPWFFGDQADTMNRYGWCSENAEGALHPVGQLNPNPLGLYDVYGNAEEWCSDWCAPEYYENSPIEDPTGQLRFSEFRKVVRGGSMHYEARNCRSAARWRQIHKRSFESIGFRLALTIDTAKPQTNDPDRVAAEWVRSINNHEFTYIVIRQNGVERKIGHEELKSDSALPMEPFELTGVFLQYNRDLTDEGLVNLRDCRHLALLNFTYTGIGDAGLVQPGGVTDVGLVNFKECRELTQLTLHSAKVDTTGLEHFRHCKKLTSLALGGVNLTGDSLESFAGCTVLENLNLKNARLEAAELEHFKDCTRLRNLDLSGNPAITNKELGYFRDCRELTTLNLARTNVDDEGLSFLSDFKRLRSLGVAETNVSGAFLESLQVKLPNCKISGKPKEPSSAGNIEPHAQKVRAADQFASEYIISVGGLLLTDRTDQWTDVVPEGPFRLTGINLERKRKGLTSIRIARTPGSHVKCRKS
jgi:formylglycine-generating enzyme required for sulfatase activity